MQYHFPENFLWGIASCAAQTEGAAFEDGKTASCWDVFCRLPGSIRGGDVMDIACDHYHLYEQDIAKMARMGIKSYRLSSFIRYDTVIFRSPACYCRKQQYLRIICQSSFPFIF